MNITKFFLYGSVMIWSGFTNPVHNNQPKLNPVLQIRFVTTNPNDGCVLAFINLNCFFNYVSFQKIKLNFMFIMSFQESSRKKFRWSDENFFLTIYYLWFLGGVHSFVNKLTRLKFTPDRGKPMALLFWLVKELFYIRMYTFYMLFFYLLKYCLNIKNFTV